MLSASNDFTIKWSNKLVLPNQSAFQSFLQMMANRVLQGHVRYGPPDARKDYIGRLEGELKKYKQTGNGEYLINIANYAHLESFAPSHTNYHFDAGVPSATRKRELF